MLLDAGEHPPLLIPRWEKLPSRDSFVSGMMARGLPLVAWPGGGGPGRPLERLSKLLAESVTRFNRREPP